MIVGIPKEIKADENRVAMTPAGVEVMKHHRHEILIQKQAGQASGFEDEDYRRAGAEIVESPGEIFGRAEMILRVKEPQPSEIAYLKEDQIYFAYLHLAASKKLTLGLLETGSINIAYETIQKDDGSLPLLMPMSEVAGAMAIQEGAKYLEMAQGGHGVLLGGVPGVEPATVVIIGGGVVGFNAAKMASGLGANVYVLDIDLERLRYLSDVMPANCFICMSSPAAIRDLVVKADVVVGAALVPGARTPVLVKRDVLKTMKQGSVVVDVSIDQGGCFESSRETTHREPTYVLDGIVHYAVSNMPGALPRTASLALTNATLPYVLEMAQKGWKKALRENSAFKRGANVIKGKVSFQGVAEALNLGFTPIEDIIG